MALHQLVRCQFEPFLRSLPSVAVKSCTPQTEKKQTFFEVELAETILFPEGGGQPWDTGTELPLPEFTLHAHFALLTMSPHLRTHQVC